MSQWPATYPLQVSVAPRNESAWNYLQGLFTFPGLRPHAMGETQEVAPSLL